MLSFRWKAGTDKLCVPGRSRVVVSGRQAMRCQIEFKWGYRENVSSHWKDSSLTNANTDDAMDQLK